MSVERLGFGVNRRGFATTVLGLLIVSGSLLSACADSPASPDPRIPPTTGPPDYLQALDWRFGASSTITVLASKSGYVDAVASSVACMNWNAEPDDDATIA
jgi:hypothetical protein